MFIIGSAAVGAGNCTPECDEHHIGDKIFLGLALLTPSWDKNWDSHSLVNGYPSFYPRIALVAASPDGYVFAGTSVFYMCENGNGIVVVYFQLIQAIDTHGATHTSTKFWDLPWISGVLIFNILCMRYCNAAPAKTHWYPIFKWVDWDVTWIND